MQTAEPRATGNPSMLPRATYRLQLHAGFDFAAATALVPYLADLGFSHLYSSPVLQAAPGSMHGYDVVDPGRINEELGGEAGFRALVSALKARDMGLVLDIVPNHMAITRENPWWQDVLENGRASRFARFFDVDWDPPERALRDRILLPILGDHYGRVLEDGHIHLLRDEGSFRVTYAEHSMPVAPRSLDGLLSEAAMAVRADELATLAEAFGALPPSTADDRDNMRRRHRDKEVLRGLLDRLLREEPEVAAAVDRVVAGINADADRFDALLERQNYRLAFWRAAERDLGYRRFFNVTSLAGLRMEDELVFAETHQVILGLVRDGSVDGLRVDHPDGLRDPAQYLERLRDAAPTSWIVVEKILQADERLRSWPVAGTTGYDFLRRVDGLFVDPAGEAPLTASYASFTGDEQPYRDVAHEAKLVATREILGSELNRLADLALRVLEGHRRHRDHTRHDVHEALRAIAASFPVYRTYVQAEEGEIAEQDAAEITTGLAEAGRRNPELAADLLEVLGRILSLENTGPLESELVMRFQQFTSALTAKGVEDTAFYRYLRLISLNEVGGDPGRFGVPIEEFHRANAHAQEHSPATQLTSSTHDTKRSEDVRLRLHVLSEIPGEWEAAVKRWSGMAAPHWSAGEPDRKLEWLLFQTLVGAWPIEAERVQEAMTKSLREARERTSWTRPDETYEASVAGFIMALLADSGFRTDLGRFVARLERPAQVNSVAATLLKLTSPGVPDVYQGTEIWDNSLVDPDNRRPVDFELHRRRAQSLDGLSVDQVLGGFAEGLPKLWTMRRALATRAQLPEAFGPSGTYRPILATGAKAKHAVAFARGEAVMTVVPRLVLGLDGDWAETVLELPAGRWRNVLSDASLDGGGPVPVAELLVRFPVALLVRERGGTAE
jgi:(1->4)-alpha-D-glucan 1-alpha-D-glucosylmutase